jgi:hypothetical protein
MARTFTDIRDAILAEKANYPELDGLDSPSQTAIWRLWVHLTARVLWVHEVLWDMFAARLQAIADRAAAGTAPWYAQQVRNFQWSDSVPYYLVFTDDDQVVYNQVVPADRIIQYVAITERVDGVVLVKAAADAGGVPAPLTTPQLTALVDYLTRIRFAGIPMEVISRPADTLRCPMAVYYRPGINPTVLMQQVQAAITDYLRNLPFSGTLLTEHLQDAVQALAPVTSVQLGTILAGNPVSGLPLAPIPRLYTTYAGYIVHDTTPGHTLDDVVTLVPDPVI